ncbi:MAG: hypothetical protein ACHREM_16495 [Polyangiales bacterium]
MRDRPYFLWDVEVTDARLRELLQQPDSDARAQWQAVIMREARYEDVWSYLSIADVVRDWTAIGRHLGRSRQFWEWLLKGWRDDGLLADESSEPTHAASA